jgi:hypothetical protein
MRVDIVAKKSGSCSCHHAPDDTDVDRLSDEPTICFIAIFRVIDDNTLPPCINGTVKSTVFHTDLSSGGI